MGCGPQVVAVEEAPPAMKGEFPKAEGRNQRIEGAEARWIYQRTRKQNPNNRPPRTTVGMPRRMKFHIPHRRRTSRKCIMGTTPGSGGRVSATKEAAEGIKPGGGALPGRKEVVN